MKNSLFYDMVNESIRKIEKAHKFSVEYGGSMDNEQKERFKKRLSELIDRL